MSTMASVLGHRKATQHGCRTRQHRACAVQALCGVAGMYGSMAARSRPGGPAARPWRGSLEGLRGAVLAPSVAGERRAEASRTRAAGDWHKRRNARSHSTPHRCSLDDKRRRKPAEHLQPENQEEPEAHPSEPSSHRLSPAAASPGYPHHLLLRRSIARFFFA